MILTSHGDTWRGSVIGAGCACAHGQHELSSNDVAFQHEPQTMQLKPMKIGHTASKVQRYRMLRYDFCNTAIVQCRSFLQ